VTSRGNYPVWRKDGREIEHKEEDDDGLEAETTCDHIVGIMWSQGWVMEKVGIRELKAQLSRHLKGVRAGRRLIVTERGRIIATIHPVDTRHAVNWAYDLVHTGRAHWAGGKPKGAARPGRSTDARNTVSAAVLEDRR
jgi:antitoxin (DNA-binding transcriptional repressor) of toxin-antitoxin stability system